MKLDNTTRKLQVLLDATVSTTACDVIVCYRDENRNAPQAIGAVPSATYLSTVSSATVVDMLPAPLVNTVVRVPERISFKNRDTTTRTPTFRFNDNATTYQFWSPQLLTGESAFYDEGQGWYATDANGNRKESLAAATNWAVTVLTVATKMSAAYVWNLWNPSDVGGTFTNGSSTAASSYADSTYFTLANSSGTLTITFVKAGSYIVNVTGTMAAGNAYTQNEMRVTQGGTATLYKNAGTGLANGGVGNTNYSGSVGIGVVATAGQTITLLPAARVTSIGATTDFQFYAAANVVYCGG